MVFSLALEFLYRRTLSGAEKWVNELMLAADVLECQLLKVRGDRVGGRRAKSLQTHANIFSRIASRSRSASTSTSRSADAFRFLIEDYNHMRTMLRCRR